MEIEEAKPEGPPPDPREELKEWPTFVSCLDRRSWLDPQGP